MLIHARTLRYINAPELLGTLAHSLESGVRVIFPSPPLPNRRSPGPISLEICGPGGPLIWSLQIISAKSYHCLIRIEQRSTTCIKGYVRPSALTVREFTSCAHTGVRREVLLADSRRRCGLK